MWVATSLKVGVDNPVVEISASNPRRRSVSLRPVMSNVTPRMPTGVPFSFLIVDERVIAQMLPPSLVIQRNSFSPGSPDANRSDAARAARSRSSGATSCSQKFGRDVHSLGV
jgi:hypothetical protein